VINITWNICRRKNPAGAHLRRFCLVWIEILFFTATCLDFTRQERSAAKGFFGHDLAELLDLSQARRLKKRIDERRDS
jgi:hypothetical protein